MNRLAQRVARTSTMLALGLPAFLAHAAPYTANQQAFSDALGFLSSPSFPSGPPPVFDTLLLSILSDIPDADLPYIYSQLSADSHGSFTSSLMFSDIGLSSAPLANMRRSMDDDSQQPSLWAQVGAGRQRIDGDGNGAQMRQDQRRSVFGGDLPIAGGWRLGGALGYGEDKLNSSSRDASAATITDSYSLYGGRDLKLPSSSLRFFGGAAYSRHDLSSSRRVAFPDDPQRNKGSYDLTTQQVFGEVALNLPMGKPGYLEPFFGLLVIEQNSDSFNERGGISAASVDSQSNRLLVSSLGSRGKQKFKVGGRDLLLAGHATWRNLQGDLRPEVDLQLAGTNKFTIQGTEMPRNSLLLEVKADYSLTRNVILDIDYNGAFSSGSNSHFVALNAHWKM
ncbi:autotransporter outer membrane beta-barrel domain-containing protein [Pseudomonas mangrovi]|uniref:Autotransporter domain-containing protein n=1 Tax=Pseudomonas mangrovi TaxID=2161748 RepID=A0A2T5P934_9PSED|nr:autotransporter outer membrane beta-barrel domain-containing protein [Pseudomonas mangrovi]PTU74230.1 hypothetical protein DBO85_08985 [Pseudomonas mangrovi]